MPSERLRPLSFPAPDHGTEVLWVEHADDDSVIVVSVPVFAYGVSRGTEVQVGEDEASRPRLLRESPGATVRGYVHPGRNATDVYRNVLVPEGRRAGRAIGPATCLDPDIVALHVHDRHGWAAVGRLCDALVERGILRFRELPDPGDRESEEGDAPAWRLVHAPPADPDET